jgi:hypothetical protein
MRIPLLLCVLLAGCVTPYSVTDRYMGRPESHRGGGPNPFREQVQQRVAAEQPGPWFIGRRYFKENYKFWGYVKRPGEPWAMAQLVMFNEQQTLAPDRQGGRLGSDNGSEYKLFGDFTGEMIYEPSSNGFYPEFRIGSAELLDPNPPSVFLNGEPNDPSKNIIQRPQ